MWRDDNQVAVSFTDQRDYPRRAPFHPPEKYPEVPGTSLDPENGVYPWVRRTLYQLGLDRENFGSRGWNPLGTVVRPGMTVFIKPNTVRHDHVEGKNVLSLITHASVVRPVLDYVCRALEGQGRILVGDSQMVSSRFDRAMRACGLASLLEWYASRTPIPIELIDLRELRAVRAWGLGKWNRQRVDHDPRGYQVVDLGDQSRFRGADPARLRISIADPRKMLDHHGGGRHEYLLPRSVLAADAIINIPKLKTHRRAAVTLALKAFFGLVAGKEGLPHYTVGSPAEGGDEYIHPSLRKRLYSRLHDLIQTGLPAPGKLVCAAARNAVWWSRRIVPFQDDVREAMWYGNDTIWRTLLDIYRAVFYADREGRLCGQPQREHFCLVDGIIGGQGNGPVAPDPIAAGVLLAGRSPVAVDAVGASLMGFDVAAIPTVRHALAELGDPSDVFRTIEVLECDGRLTMEQFLARRNLHFAPHPQWQGRIERASRAQGAPSAGPEEAIRSPC